MINYKFETVVKKFVYFLENKGEYNNKYANMILDRATSWDKEAVLKELERQVRIFSEYDEKKTKVDFNYLPFCEEFMKDKPKSFIDKNNKINYNLYKENK